MAGVEALVAWRDVPYTDDLTSWRDTCEALDNARLPEIAAALRRLAKIERVLGAPNIRVISLPTIAHDPSTGAIRYAFVMTPEQARELSDALAAQEGGGDGD